MNRMAQMASARHILVKTKEEAEKIKQLLDKGGDFEKIARKHSTCPSKKKGGNLGEFRRGDMVKAFNDVVFKGEILKIHGPVKTRFGFHIIQILYRN